MTIIREKEVSKPYYDILSNKQRRNVYYNIWFCRENRSCPFIHLQCQYDIRSPYKRWVIKGHAGLGPDALTQSFKRLKDVKPFLLMELL